MTRVHLAQLLRDLASAHDYAFFSAPDEYMPSEIDRYPAAWLTPPRLKEVEGRRHGKRTYEIQLHLLQPGMRLTHAERARRLDEMEQTLLGIFTELTEDPKVICVERLSIAPAPAPSPITERSRRVPRPKRSSGSDRPPCPAPPPETRPATRPERCETACRSPPRGQSLPEQAYAPVRTAINANS